MAGEDVVGIYVFSDNDVDVYRLSFLDVIHQECSPEELGKYASKIFKDKSIRFENGVYYCEGDIYNLDGSSLIKRTFTRKELYNFHSTRLENIIDSLGKLK